MIQVAFLLLMLMILYLLLDYNYMIVHPPIIPI
nr:MAG TPA: hypothetical protein [Caudoviricetes sp.]